MKFKITKLKLYGCRVTELDFICNYLKNEAKVDSWKYYIFVNGGPIHGLTITIETLVTMNIIVQLLEALREFKNDDNRYLRY